MAGCPWRSTASCGGPSVFPSSRISMDQAPPTFSAKRRSAAGEPMGPVRYAILGVARDAAPEEIKKAFRKRARELHPDVNPGDPDAEARFKETAEAYEVLSNPETRAVYDRYGHEGVRGRGGGTDFADFGSFQDLFDAFFGGDAFGQRGGPQRGEDIAVSVTISFVESARGAAREVEVDRDAVCDVCEGSGAAPGSWPGALRDVRRSGPGAPGGPGTTRPVPADPGVPDLRRPGRGPRPALPELPGARPRTRARHRVARDPGRALRRTADPDERAGARRRGGRPGGRPLRARAGERGRATPPRRPGRRRPPRVSP